MSITYKGESAEEQESGVLPRRAFLSSSVKIAAGVAAGMGLDRWLRTMEEAENPETTPHQSETGRAPELAIPECAQLCTLLRAQQMGYVVVTNNTLHVPFSEDEHFTVVIDRDGTRGGLIITITAPQTIQTILNREQAYCHTVEDAAKALVSIIQMAREQSQPHEEKEFETVDGRKIYDA